MEVSAREQRKRQQLQEILKRQEENDLRCKIDGILRKSAPQRSPEELQILETNRCLARKLQKVIEKEKLEKSKREEQFDSAEELKRKCEVLAECIKEARHLIVYTGAGISTSADIPDYRGPNGLWTKCEQGESATNIMGSVDLTSAKPTFTHMALAKLHSVGVVKHLVSQNCDGLHVRSGFPREHLSEIHGNMFLEICADCDPDREYFRTFDVTGKTRWRRHKTGRLCHQCDGALCDTIVLFGEKNRTQVPMRWELASENAGKADVVLCLGTSLEVLKDYSLLWGSHQKVYIVNLQWTPKDSVSELKIHGRCDDVMKSVMSLLGVEVNPYNPNTDPMTALVVPLRSDENLPDSAGSKSNWFNQGLKNLATAKEKYSSSKKKSKKRKAK